MAEKTTYRVGVLGSGKGSNFVSIADSCASGKSPVQVAIVLSDVQNAPILEHAKNRGIEARYIHPGRYRTKLDETSEPEYIKALQDANVDLVVLAGFMRILKGDFLKAFPMRVINIHPSLLPAFPGMEAWKQALDYGVKVTGCTVHIVDQGIDTGPIIAQRVVPVLDDDTPETLHRRIQEAEWSLYPEVITGFARNEIFVNGRKVMWKKATDL
ncbi:MAG TPA: phosphoribosylglycinamide formyltransferase [Verrucomicrobiota bacterium]|nr:phosphoribosylglycinamide formyltransferase [Verrucomicrobiota bacterium]